MVGSDVARSWLVSRIDQRVAETMRGLLEAIAEQLALATSEAVTVRMLSDDGQWLFPVTAHHPAPEMRDAMLAIMDETVQRPDSGLWRVVVEERRTVRWRIPPGEVPADASAQQSTTTWLSHPWRW